MPDGGHVFPDAIELGTDPHVLVEFLVVFVGDLAQEVDVPRSRLQSGSDHVESGRLAGSVRSKQAQHFSAVDSETGAFHGHEPVRERLGDL